MIGFALTWIDIARGLAVTDIKQIARDRFLGFILGYSLVLAVLVRFGVPPLAGFLARRYGIDVVPYYGLVSSFVGLTLGSSMVGLVLGFLLLDARESRVIEAIAVSPVTFDRFLNYRVAMPMALAVALNPLCAWLAGIGLPSFGPMIALSVAGMMFAGIGTLALATFSDNKVQAFAVMKMISGASMVPLAAYFVAEPWQWLFGLFPPYWLFKAWWVAVEGGASCWLYAALGLVVNALFLRWMRALFERRVRKS
jgi:fluoroquinolone transport system permease protein